MSANLRQNAAGFTLVEVMLTLLIMAGIMVTVTQILTASRTSRDEIHNIQERQLAGPAILARIEQDLRAVFPLDRSSGGVLRVQNRVLSGFDADTIDLVCTVDGVMPFREKPHEPFRRADVNEVGYRLRQRPDSDDFLEIYRREGFGVDEDPFEGGRFALLHDRVKSFNVQVYEQDGPEAEPIEEWSSAESQEYVGIPARLEIELTIELAPRLVREQLVIDTRTLTYKRIFRFSEALRRALAIQPKPRIPSIAPPAAYNPGAQTGQPPPDEGDGGDNDEDGGDGNPLGGG